MPALRPATVGAAGLAPPPRLGSAELAVLAVLARLLAHLARAGRARFHPEPDRRCSIPLDVLHVLAMSVWIGGLVALVVVLPAATRALANGDRTRLLAAVLVRFSPLALACRDVCCWRPGSCSRYVHVRSLDNLIDTGFGRAVLIKIGLLLVLIALGAYNRSRALPRLRRSPPRAASHRAPPASACAARCTEVGMLAVVLGVTVRAGQLRAAGRRRHAGPFSTTKTVGPLELQMTVDPAEVGRNEMHLYLFRARDGTQFNGTKQLRVRMTLPEQGHRAARSPSDQGAVRATTSCPATDFGVAGDWEVKLHRPGVGVRPVRDHGEGPDQVTTTGGRDVDE